MTGAGAWRAAATAAFPASVSAASKRGHVVRSWRNRLLLWFAACAGLSLAAALAVQPESCSTDPSCQEHLSSNPTYLHFGAVCCLGSLLLHELSAAWTKYRSMTPLESVVDHVWDAIVPHTLVCSLFLIVLMENLVLLFNGPHFFFSTPGEVQGLRGGRPIFTVIFMEWMFSVPILIILTGHCALKRSIEEVSPPVIISNFYIALAWYSNFVVDPSVRWTLIVMCFALFFWSAMYILSWGELFMMDREEEDVVNDAWRLRRDLMPVCLVVTYAMYGGVFLCSHLGLVSAFQERVCYIALAVTVKLGMSMAFTSFMAEAQLDALIDLAVNQPFPFDRQQVSSP